MYDCSAPSSQGLYRLLDRDTCRGKFPATHTEELTRGTLLQIPRYIEIDAISAEITSLYRDVYCSYNRYPSPLELLRNYHSFQPVSVGLAEVEGMITKEVVALGGMTTPLIFNQELLLADSSAFDNEGFCRSYSHQASTRVYRAIFRKTKLKVLLLPRGAVDGYVVYSERVSHVAAASRGKLADGTMIFWEPQDIPRCPWESIYSGTYTIASGPNNTRVGLFESITAGLILKNRIHLCNIEVSATTDPQLYVSVGHSVEAPGLSGDTPGSWSSLISSALQYQMTNSHIQLANLTSTISINQCILEQKIFRDIVYSAITSPEIVGFRITGELGSSVVVAGSALNVKKCIPVEAMIREMDHCNDRIPIQLVQSNTSVFMDPVTRVIRKTASRMPCSDPQNPFFELRGAWYKMNPHMDLNPTPQEMPTQLEHFARLVSEEYRGIYPSETVRTMSDRWMYKDSKEETMNVLLNLGNPVIGDSGSSLWDTNERLTRAPTMDSYYPVPSVTYYMFSLLVLWLVTLTAGMILLCVRAHRSRSSDRHTEGRSPSSNSVRIDLRSIESAPLTRQKIQEKMLEEGLDEL